MATPVVHPGVQYVETLPATEMGNSQFQSKLRPHQVEPVKHLVDILRHSQAAVDLSITGAGKTYVGAAVATLLQLPTLVVCPHIAQSNWQRAAAHFGDSVSVINYEMLRTGRTPYGSWEKKSAPTGHWQCEHCQLKVDDPEHPLFPCYTNTKGEHKCIWKRHKAKRGKFIFNPAVRSVIFDEVHRCNGYRTQNAEMLIGAFRSGAKILGLSATLGETVEKFWALGYVLGLHKLTGVYGFENWARQYGCRRDINFGPGLHWLVGEKRQQEVMAGIRAQIIPSRGVRLTEADIPGFPERDISAELYDLEKPGLVDELYGEMHDALEQLKTHASDDADPESPLTKILRAHQKVELLKVPIALEMHADLIEKGFSVGFFCNYSQTIDELARRLNSEMIVDGRNLIDRDLVIRSFQQDTARSVIVNSRAGGICIDLQDVRGQFPRFGLVFPCFDIVLMRQLAGRFHRDGAKSKCHYRIMFAANSVEEQIYRAWRRKSNNLDALNDADLNPFGIPLNKI